MSLAVYLTRKKWVSYDEGATHTVEEEEVYWANITHNLGAMASEAGIYEALWRPYKLKQEYNISENDDDAEYEFAKTNDVFAHEIINILEKGLKDLKEKPDYYEQFNSSNGWGLYEHFVPFVEKYLEACKQYPQTIINVSR